MNDYSEFDEETREKLERLDRSIASYYALVEKDWQQKKQQIDTPKPPTAPYTARREIFESCRKTTPNGASYFSLGEYYKKLTGM